jgi:hypothetical protein
MELVPAQTARAGSVVTLSDSNCDTCMPADTPADSARLTTAALVRVSARTTSGSVRITFRAGVDWDRPGSTRQTSDGAC